MRKALKTSIDSPFSGSKMFVGFDPTHSFKCFYTNFMNKKFFKCPSYAEGNEELRASFAHLKQLYNIEFGKSVRMAYKLSDKTLNPKSIERSNVALADSCFHESTINALKYYSDHGHDDFAETAAVLQIFRTWFNALNVKSLYTGQRTKDVNRNPVTKEDRSVLEVFHQFGKWLDRWKASGNIGLSTQTFKAAILTTQMLIDLCNYLLDVKGLDYILLGHTSSDYLESRFGWYRQSSGANYYISVLQILQSEKSIRIKSLIESGFQMSDLKNIFAATDNSTTSDSLTDELTAVSQLIPEYSLSESLVVAPEDQAIIYYVAGAIVRSILKKFTKKSCDKCCSLLSGGIFGEGEVTIHENLTDEISREKEEFVSLVTRGGLLKPSDLVYVTCVHAWSLYHSIKDSNDAFNLLLSSSNPRTLFTEFFITILEDNDSMTETLKTSCGNGHTFLTFAKRAVSTFFNLMAKNYVSNMNDQIHAGKKRTDSNSGCSADARKIRKLT